MSTVLSTISDHGRARLSRRILRRSGPPPAGSILLIALVFGAIGVLVITSLMDLVFTNIRLAMDRTTREQALHVAESGIDYYRWHLAHNPTDYQDGTGGPGPYVHDVRDPTGRIIGQFSLDILPPPSGSTLVTVSSTGTVSSDLTKPRSIRVRFAIPSVAQYAVLGDEALRLGEETETAGPVHANAGIRFDGVARNVVSSAVTTYQDPDHGPPEEEGVHTHKTDPTTVFLAGRQFPVPAVDFAGITADLAQIKADAQASGVYLAPSGAGSLGYHLVVKPDDTIDVYRVTALRSPPSGCTNQFGQAGWGTWSIQSESFVATRPMPANGRVFVEDHVWVDGRIDSARLTIAAAVFPAGTNDANITVNADLMYTDFTGEDILGLFAQNNVNVGLYSDTNLRIDGGLIAQNGRVGRYYYLSACGPERSRQSLTLYGMIATNRRYGFAYTDGTGYALRTISYDSNFRYNPPPATPLTTDQHEIVSWEEL